MNPLDATIIRLGIYIGQLENQVSELHKQLLDKSRALEESEKANDQLLDQKWGRDAEKSAA